MEPIELSGLLTWPEVQRLLVATDLSDNGLIALHAGALLASELEASLQVLHCVPRHFLRPAPAEDTNAYWDEAAPPPGSDEISSLRHRLGAQVERVAPGLPASNLRVSVGRPHVRITEGSEELDAQLVVLGAHTPRRLLDGLLGTTAERVLRTCPRPLLFTNQSLSHMPRNILLATDFSKPADHALATIASWAGSWARHHAAGTVSLQLLHVAAFMHPLYQPTDVGTPLQERVLAAALLGGPALRVQPRVFSAPTASEGILEAAQDMEADMVVIGTHGLGFVMRALVGGVTAEVIRTVRRPILAIPPVP